MALLKIARLGNPVLIRAAQPVTPGDLAGPDIQRLIDDMFETMAEERGVGLAAPQVHRSLRLFVMDAGPNGEGESGEAPIVIVNPALSFPTDRRMRLWEGCLSIPGLRGPTERFAEVVVDCVDRQGRPCRHRFEGLSAAIAQHENDHLDGILFVQRMPDLSLLAFEDELSRHGGEPEENEPEEEDRGWGE